MGSEQINMAQALGPYQRSKVFDPGPWSLTQATGLWSVPYAMAISGPLDSSGPRALAQGPWPQKLLLVQHMGQRPMP